MRPSDCVVRFTFLSSASALALAIAGATHASPGVNTEGTSGGTLPPSDHMAGGPAGGHLNDDCLDDFDVSAYVSAREAWPTKGDGFTVWHDNQATPVMISEVVDVPVPARELAGFPHDKPLAIVFGLGLGDDGTHYDVVAYAIPGDAELLGLLGMEMDADDVVVFTAEIGVTDDATVLWHHDAMAKQIASLNWDEVITEAEDAVDAAEGPGLAAITNPCVPNAGDAERINVFCKLAALCGVGTAGGCAAYCSDSRNRGGRSFVGCFRACVWDLTNNRTYAATCGVFVGACLPKLLKAVETRLRTATRGDRLPTRTQPRPKWPDEEDFLDQSEWQSYIVQ